MTCTNSLKAVTQPLNYRGTCRCLSRNTSRRAASVSTRSFTTSSIRHDQKEVESSERPRWLYTPERMKAPFRARLLPVDNQYAVNEDPRKVDHVYTKVLGNRGDKMLTEEVKWLAITHKSFDHGRRGYNDRLAFLGKRIVDLQTSLELVHSPLGVKTSITADHYGRMPFQHPALDGLGGLNETSRAHMLDRDRIAGVAERYGMLNVIRWRPKKADNIRGSGAASVLSQCLYAIVGAVALQKGGEVANKIARERILVPLGLS